MNKPNFLLLVLTTLLVSCAHKTMRGGVAMKVSDTEAHVCLGEGEVKVGDKVNAFYNDCQGKGSGGKDGAYGVPCVKTKIGKGTVTKILNDHYSVVEFEDGVKFTEGTFVEKL